MNIVCFIFAVIALLVALGARRKIRNLETLVDIKINSVCRALRGEMK